MYMRYPSQRNFQKKKMDLMMILLFLVTIHFVSSEESFPFSLGDRALLGDRHSRSRAPYDYVDPYAERRFENRRSTLADRSPEYIDPRFRRRALPRFRGSVPRFGRRHQTFNPIELLRDIEMHRRSPPMEIDFELPESEDLDSSMPSPREFVKTLNSPPAFVFGRRFFGDLPSAATPILDMEKFVTDMTPEEVRSSFFTQHNTHTHIHIHTMNLGWNLAPKSHNGRNVYHNTRERN